MGMGTIMGWIMGILILVILAVLVSCLKIVPQAQAYVIERLGAYQGTWSVGFHIKVPFLDKVARKVNLKEQNGLPSTPSQRGVNQVQGQV